MLFHKSTAASYRLSCRFSRNIQCIKLVYVLARRTNKSGDIHHTAAKNIVFYGTNCIPDCLHTYTDYATIIKKSGTVPEKWANPSKGGDAKPEGSKAAKAAMTAGCKHQRRRFNLFCALLGRRRCTP